MNRCRSATRSAALLFAVLLLSQHAAAQKLRGHLGVEARYFPEDPLFEEQSAASTLPSVLGSLDWSADLTPDIRFDLSAFMRAASHTENDVTGDIREAVIRSRIKAVDFKLGVLQENWSVLEAWNPVDLLNQRDMVEDFQGEVKLGQPGVSATTFWQDLVISAWILPYTRERRIAEGEDRLRTLPAPVENSIFEDGQSDNSFALRAQYRLGDFDVALSQFQGHTREPIYQPVLQQWNLVGFDELYEEISQTGLELQYVAGDTVFKAEVINQTGGADSFVGSGIGSETTFNQIRGGFASMTAYVEAYYDTRNELAPLTPFQRDVFVGIRYNTNNVHDALVDVRYTHDVEFHSDLIDIRASRRLGDAQTLSAQLLIPQSVSDDPALQGFENDPYLKLSWAWYL